MDYITSFNGEQIHIETIQLTVRDDLIECFKNARKEAGISQKKLGVLSGIAQANISRFEGKRYNPSLDFMVRIASALGRELKIELV